MFLLNLVEALTQRRKELCHVSEMCDHPSNAIRSVDRWLPSLPSSNLHGMASVQCVNNGLTSATLALRCQLEKILLPPPILRERVNSQTDYPGVNSDVYENPIQIYANSLLSLSLSLRSLSPQLL